MTTGSDLSEGEGLPGPSNPRRLLKRKELTALARRNGFSPEKAKRAAVRLAGKAGPVSGLKPDLSFGELLRLWYGLRPITAPGLYRSRVNLGGEDVVLADDENRVEYLLSEAKWQEACDNINRELGISPQVGPPVWRGSLCTFLEESRDFRAMTPHADKVSKRAFHGLGADNTCQKFRASYGRSDLVHLGSGFYGRLSCVGTQGTIFVDPLLNGLRWQELELDGARVVSDVAMPNEMRNGMGSDVLLYDLLRRGDSLIKMNFLNLEPGDALVYKGRPHNLEVIVASESWGGPREKAAVSVESIREANGMRNIFCQGHIPLVQLQAKIEMPPPEEIFFTQEEVGRHLLQQLSQTVLDSNVHYIRRKHYFDLEMFEHLIDDGFRPFNPSALNVPTSILGRLKKAGPDGLKLALAGSGLDAATAANVYSFMVADHGRADRRTCFLALLED